MALILRVDVDKPYGNSSLFKRILSKFSEDYITFYNPCLGYLSHLEKLLQFCNENKINGYFYFRLCTFPSAKITELIQSGGHKAGLHTENTRSSESFENELHAIRKRSDLSINTFTKHGSGELKLGKYHYAPYEPEKYSEWAENSGCGFHFGNMIATSASDFDCKNNFYSHMFWIDREYRKVTLKSVEEVIQIAKTRHVPVLIHPCEFNSSENAKNDLVKLVEYARQKNISWITPF